jgi:AraC family transcriptional regulator
MMNFVIQDFVAFELESNESILLISGENMTMLLSETGLNIEERYMTIHKSSDIFDWSNLNISIVSSKPYDHELTHGGGDELWIAMAIDPLEISVITNHEKIYLNLQPNQLCIHSPRAILKTVRRNESRVLHAFLKKDLLSEVLGDLFDRDIESINVTSKFGINDADMVQILKIFHNALLRPTEQHQMKMEYIARALIVDVFRKHLTLSGNGERKSFDRKLTMQQIRDVIGFIDENLLSTVMLSDLSTIAKLSRTSFIQQFKSTFNETPYQYIIRSRILKAQELLEKSNLPLVDIALLCGFTDQAHFSKYFRKIKSTTPSNYRRQFQ